MTVRIEAGVWDALGHRFRLWSSDPAIAAHLAALYAELEPAAAPHEAEYGIEVVTSADPRKAGFVVHADQRVSAPKQSLGRALAVLGSRINAAVVATPRRLPLLHAAAAARDGAAALLPASMESGKSTLVAGLVASGWSYLTDEAALVHGSELGLRGLLKPISLDAGSWQLFPDARPEVTAAALTGVDQHQWQVPPGALGLTPPSRSAHVGVVVFPRYREGAPTELQPLRRVEVLESLLHCTFGGPRSREAFIELAAVAEAVPGYRLTSGSLAECLEAVRSALEDSLAIGA